jgi:hypothetical protein
VPYDLKITIGRAFTERPSGALFRLCQGSGLSLRAPPQLAALHVCYNGSAARDKQNHGRHHVKLADDPCLLEPREDLFGRLSMWRAYGQSTGVAIVINGGPFLRPTDALKAYASPVAYLTPIEFEKQFELLLDGIDSEADFLRERGENLVLNDIFATFRAAILCTKHPGFHEEREWRVIYSPTFARSDRITTDIVTINGVPQPVCKIPLRDVPEEGLKGLEIPTLIDRVIIGPTEYPNVIREAFTGALTRAGVADAVQRIVVSDIPLRR